MYSVNKLLFITLQQYNTNCTFIFSHIHHVWFIMSRRVNLSYLPREIRIFQLARSPNKNMGFCPVLFLLRLFIIYSRIHNFLFRSRNIHHSRGDVSEAKFVYFENALLVPTFERKKTLKR